MAKHVEPLDVWLYNRRIAQLSQPDPSRLHYTLTFTEEALDCYGEGKRILSLSLPISQFPVVDKVGKLSVTNFVEGLLPEGNLRQQLAAMEGVPSLHLMPLLRAVGGDCAGAVQFLRPGLAPTEGTVRELSAEEVTRLVADLPTYHLPKGARLQASLAGIQDKVLLAALDDGKWGWPEDGAASTHLVKPAPLQGGLPHLIEAENWSLQVARTAEIPAAETRVQRFENRDAILVARYDRTADGRRVHQEDFCQALGIPPHAKYESTASGHKGLSRLALIMAVAAPQAKDDPTELRRALLSAVTFNVVMGNGDTHSKNYSLLVGERGEVSLAPMYDTAPVMFIDPAFQGTGHTINGRTSINAIGADDLVAEARTWGMPEADARRTVASVVERTRFALQRVAAPPGLERMRSNLDEFWHRRAWATPERQRALPQNTSSVALGYPAGSGGATAERARPADGRS